MSSWTRRAVTGATAVALGAGSLLTLPTAALAAVDPESDLVINEVYGGGGNSGARYAYDFVEIYNAGESAIDLSTYSLQYASSAGTTWSGVIPLTGSVAPGELFVVRAATNDASMGAELPVEPDVTNDTVNLSGSNGNVALASSLAALTCQTTACQSDPAVVDLVGYGSGAAFAGAGAAPQLSSTTSASRDAAHTNTADNAADFTAGVPSPGADELVAPDPVAATIPEIQGTGDTSPLLDAVVIVHGVVTAAWPTGGFDAFTIQVPGTGGAIDPAAHDGSDALYVSQASGTVEVMIGDHVQVTGMVSEVNGVTTVTAASGADVVVLDEPAAAVTPLDLAVWPVTAEEREDIESMLYLPTGEFTVTNTYTTNQYGEVGLAFGTAPLVQPTDVARPGSPEEALVAATNAERSVILDDGASTNYLAEGNGDLVPPYVSLTEPIRVGASVDFTEPVVVGFGFGAWRLQPTTPVTGGQTPEADGVVFENTRTAAPDADRLGDGDLTVASFNVLNYFTTLGAETPGCEPWTDPDGDPVSVRTGCDPRGAWDPEDLARQQSKIVDAINAVDASVVGLMEIENSLVVDGVDDEALATLVDALNAAAGAGTWAYVPSSDELPPVEEMDVITNAIIYQPAQVETVGEMRVLGDLSGPDEAFSNAREPLGQAFTPTGGGEPFFVVVNHFKSKGSGEGPGNEEDTGQGLSNADRVEQATAVRDWVPTVIDDYTEPVEDVFIVGDINAYTQEDPMVVLYEGGYVDMNFAFGEPEFSYSFRGLSGSLDHVLANASALARVTGVDIWQINAPESVALEYSRYDYHGELYWEEGPYRSSDHDPVIVAFTSADAVPTFPDVSPGNPFADEIAWVVENGIAQGYADGLFRPSVAVSRQAMAAFLYRLVHDGQAAPACEGPAAVDVSERAEFCGEIAWMISSGLSQGYDDDTFRPTAPVSRQATAAFLYRQLEGGVAPACTEAPFTDVATSHRFCGEIQWLVEAGLTTGYDDGTFRSTWPVTRQAMAAFLYRIQSSPA